MPMNSRQRVQALFQRQPIDTMPIFSGTSMIVIQALEAEGLAFADIHTAADRMATAALVSARATGADGVVVPFDITYLAEALGGRPNFYQGSAAPTFPTLKDPIWTALEQVAIPGDLLERGRLPLVAAAVTALREQAPELALGVCLRGPLTQLGQLLALELVLKSAFKAPDAVAAAIDCLVDALIAVGSLWRGAGADYITLSEPGANAEVLPPKLFKRLVQPALQRILAAWEAPRVLHISGVTAPIVEAMQACGADALAFDVKSDMAATRSRLGPDVLIFGNYDVYALPCDPATSPEQAAAAVRGIVADGVDAVWPGSDLWPEVKPENLEAMAAAVRDAGRDPSPAVGRC
jgi:[methyl-Co(III) methanol-specific corrinoid protein]:coenzyme M methyltransferase